MSGRSTIENSSMTRASPWSGHFASAPEGPLLGLEFEDAVDGPGVLARRLGEPLGRPPGGRREDDGLPPPAEDVDDGPDDGRLAGARAAGDDQDLLPEALRDGQPLGAARGRARGPSRVGDGGLEVERRASRTATEARSWKARTTSSWATWKDGR